MEISSNDNECHVNPRREPIAVIGIGCRFPGRVKGADSFWKMMLDRTDAITDVPPERWNHAVCQAFPEQERQSLYLATSVAEGILHFQPVSTASVSWMILAMERLSGSR